MKFYGIAINVGLKTQNPQMAWRPFVTSLPLFCFLNKEILKYICLSIDVYLNHDNWFAVFIFQFIFMDNSQESFQAVNPLLQNYSFNGFNELD